MSDLLEPDPDSLLSFPIGKRAVVWRRMHASSQIGRINSGPEMPPVAEAIRERVFTPELKNIAGSFKRGITNGAEISNDALAESHIEIAENWFTEGSLSYKPERLKKIYDAYIGASASYHPCSELLDRLRLASGASSVILLARSPEETSYRPYFAIEADDITLSRAFFGISDAYLDASLRTTVLIFSDYADDKFFTKRFSPEFLRKYKVGLFWNLNLFEFPGYLGLFFESEDTCHSALNEIGTTASAVIRDLIPLLYRYIAEADTEKDDFLVLKYATLREVRDMSEEGLNIINMTFSGICSGSSCGTVVRDIADSLRERITPDERIIISPDRKITMALFSTPCERLIEYAGSLAERAGITAESVKLEYPRDGYNLFNYFQ